MAVLTYEKGCTTKLSENFSVSEFTCHGSGCCSSAKIDTKLVDYLQQIRDHFGGVVTITSGYRCAKHNAAVGGVKTSYHTKGKAADIQVEGATPAQVAAYAESIGVKGIGLYETDRDGHFVHIDTRTSKAFWYGQAQAPRGTFGGSAGYTLQQFVKDVQKACGATQDGVAGPDTLAATVTLSMTKNRAHAAVLPVQRRLAALGYTQVGKADGVAGLKFAKAVRAYQAANGCKADCEITKAGKTWRMLLGME